MADFPAPSLMSGLRNCHWNAIGPRDNGNAELMPLPVAFDGFIELSKRVSPTCLISFEREEGWQTIRWIVWPDARLLCSRLLCQSTGQPADLSGSFGCGG